MAKSPWTFLLRPRYPGAVNVHCSALRASQLPARLHSSTLSNANKSLASNDLSYLVSAITRIFGFGAANAFLRRNKEAANSSYDLHSLRQRASLPKSPFWLSERNLASPFLTLPTTRSLLN